MSPTLQIDKSPYLEENHQIVMKFGTLLHIWNSVTARLPNMNILKIQFKMVDVRHFKSQQPNSVTFCAGKQFFTEFR